MNATAIEKELIRAGYAGRIERDFRVAALTTYRLGGPAAVYLEPSEPDDLQRLGEAIGSASARDVEVLALGRGSNVVISDEGFDGIVVRLGASFSWIESSGDAGMRAGASTSLPLLANWAARRGLAGIEFAVAIPGSVGGGVRMNAGAHGGEMSDTLATVRIFDLGVLAMQDRHAADLDLGYRRSNLTADDVVVHAVFELRPEDPAAVRARMESFRSHRAATQPGAVQNAGSVFKNPLGDSAGRLVEAAGLKGFRVGGAEVSELHANFFLAGDGATAQDVFDLVRIVRARVIDRFGVALEPEVKFVGAFERRVENGAVGGRR